MDCERYDKVALNLLYEELDELTSAAARRHLHHCTRCKSLSSGMQATRELARLPLVDPPEGLYDRILTAERLAHKELSLRQRLERTISVMAGYAMRPQLAMAATLLLCVAFSLVFLQGRPGGHDQVSVTERGVPGLDADALLRHSIVTEALPPEPETSERAPGPALAEAKSRAEPPMQEAREDSGRKKLALGRALEDSEAGLPSASRARAQSDNAQFEQALSAYHQGRYAEAEQQFARVAGAGGPDAPRAALYEAHAARNGAGCQKAAGLYDAVATRYAETITADDASWHAASCYRALGQNLRAEAHYRALAARPGYSERANQALATLAAEGAESPGRAAVAAKAGARAESPAGAAAEAESASGRGHSPPSSAPAKPSAPPQAQSPAQKTPSDETKPPAGSP